MIYAAALAQCLLNSLTEVSTHHVFGCLTSALGELFGNLKKASSEADWRGFFSVLAALGLTLPEPEGVEVPDEIAELAKLRWEARQGKDWEASDRYRDELAGKGWVVKDGREGYEVVPS